MEIIAHRGASHDAPENTLAAVRLGWQQHADAVEIDVRLSKDGHVVVLHDDDTRRVAGVSRKASEQTLAELQQLDAGAWKDARFAGEPIPTLEQVIATIPDGKRLFIEVKCGHEIVAPLQRALDSSSRAPAQFVIIAFSDSVLRAVKEALPAVETCWLSSFTYDANTNTLSPTANDLIHQASAAGFDGLDLWHEAVDATLMQQAREAGLKCFAWTVNDAGDARRLVAAGADGITTDRPAWLREQVEVPQAATE